MEKIKNSAIEETFKIAVANHGQNKIKEAQILYHKVLELNPNHLGALHNLGIIFKDLGDFQKAKDTLNKAIEININYSNAHISLGAIYAILGEFQKATNCFEKVIEINPNTLKVHYNLGKIFKELGEFKKAKSCFEKEIAINPNYADAHNNLGNIFKDLGENHKAIKCYEKAVELNPDDIGINANLSALYIRALNDPEKSMNLSYKTSKIFHNKLKFINQSVSLFRLKHDVQQAQYLISKNYELEGIKQFQKIGNEILIHKENIANEDNFNKQISLNPDEINSLLPFYKLNLIYQTKKISGSCINPNKNWQDVENEYLNSSNQIIYIDDFLSEEALIELREFCLVSKVWNKEYYNPFLGAYSSEGFISPIHLQIAVDLKQKLPKLFGPHRLGNFWGFKYDSKLGKGINIHADFALHNLNFWITPDEFNNNKNSGGLKVYDTLAPEHWNFKDYNMNTNKIYKFLKENNANCTNIPYKFNRAVLFNSAYFHETDKIDFRDEYEGRRINNTYLFGNRVVKNS
mgnify:CR=1 FL=1